ncbi:MAG: SdrD B-like domain-containing protein [Ilumatobacteraceae bacterium]
MTTNAFGDALTNPVTTNASGGYSFDSVAPGTYTVTVTAPSGHHPTRTDQGADDTVDSDGLSAQTPSLTAGTNHTSHDIGLVQDGSIAGQVIADRDHDGVADVGEPGISGVTVTLTGTDYLGNPITPVPVTTTGANFSFTGVLPGTYTLTETQPTDFGQGHSFDGTTSTPNSDAVTGVVVGSGDARSGFLFTDDSTVLSGRVFEDANNNGSDDSEPGIAGVDVELDDGSSQVVVTTDVNGAWTFTELAAATYQVTELSQPSGFADGGEIVGTGGGTAGSDTITGIVLSAGDLATGYAFGEYTEAAIDGRVFADLDGDGIDDTEPGIAGVTVTLGGAATASTTTASDGSFSFSTLAPGTYTLTESQPTGYGAGMALPGSTGTASGANAITSIVVTSNTASTGHAFADPTASLAGVVLDDANGNGLVDSGETGVAGVTVTLSGTSTGTAVTDGTGHWIFPGLLGGTYTVTETQPAGYDDGTDTAGSAGGTVGNDVISAITLADGEVATGYVFGEQVASSLSGAVFDDRNRDGITNTGEPGISGVTVRLTGTVNSVPITPVDVVTGIDGHWTFTDLAPGTYTVTEVAQPAGFADGAEGVPSGDSTSSTAVDDVISNIVVNSNETLTGYTFGEWSASVAGFVYADDDANGTMNGGETGIDGVTITVTSGSVTRTATIAGGGLYVVTGLPAGIYTVTETQPNGRFDWVDFPGPPAADLPARLDHRCHPGRRPAGHRLPVLRHRRHAAVGNGLRGPQRRWREEFRRAGHRRGIDPSPRLRRSRRRHRPDDDERVRRFVDHPGPAGDVLDRGDDSRWLSRLEGRRRELRRHHDRNRPHHEHRGRGRNPRGRLHLRGGPALLDRRHRDPSGSHHRNRRGGHRRPRNRRPGSTGVARRDVRQRRWLRRRVGATGHLLDPGAAARRVRRDHGCGAERQRHGGFRRDHQRDHRRRRPPDRLPVRRRPGHDLGPGLPGPGRRRGLLRCARRWSDATVVSPE